MKHNLASSGLPAKPPRPAAEIFGDRLPLAQRYAEILADSGVSHGLIGPREAVRLWERHLINCAIVESVLPHRTRLVDVGSGAGLPGLVLAIARPDIEVLLMEPMLRRTRWLDETIADLGLGNVTVRRGRAQEFHGRLITPVVTARAVARLSELAAWCLPLLGPGGRLLALKGRSAEQELAEDLPALRRLGVESAGVRVLGESVVATPTRVIELTVAPASSGSAVPTTSPTVTMRDDGSR